MNNTQNPIARVKEILTKAKAISIIVPPNATNDALASATALYLGVLKMGKSASLATSQPVKSELAGADKFQSSLATGGDSLMISFPYTDGTIDKVDYNIQGSSFNLIVTPRPGFPKLNPEQVNYSYTGGSVDAIITIDSPTLQSLGEIYTADQNQFNGKDIINIDRHLTNSYFGTVNLVNKTVSSVSELVLSVLQELQIEIDRDMATNLYSGIASSTNNFTSYSTNADTFEHIATLLRLGAVKKAFRRPTPPPQETPGFPPMRPPMNSRPPQYVNGSGPEMTETPPIEQVEKEKQPTQSGFENKSPQDWLKPKIFKGTGLV